MASSHLSTSAFGSVQEYGTNILNAKLLKPLDDVLRCRICFEYFTNCMITKCSHNYCSVCIRRYMNYKSQCPTCFQVATEPELQNNRLIDEILRIYMKIRESLHVPHESVDVSFPQQSTSSKSTINISISEAKEAGTSNNNSVKQEKVDIASDEVSCPVCYTTVANSRINIHLDTCLKQTEERNERKFLPKLVYHLMTDKDIKKKLKEHDLSTSGDRQALIRRHKNFVTLFNANCDSLNPKPVSELLLEIERQELEERLNAAQKSIQTNKRSDPSEIEKEHESYLEEHKSQFNALIQDVQERVLAERHIKRENDNIEVSASNITDESGNVIGKSTISVRNEPILGFLKFLPFHISVQEVLGTVKVEPSEPSLEDPVIIKEEPPESLYEDPYLSHNQELILPVKSTVCDNESETGMEYMDTGCKKSSQLPFRVKKEVPALKIKDEPQFLLDPIPYQECKADSPSSTDDFESNKTPSNKYHKKKNARKLSSEEKNSQRKK